MERKGYENAEQRVRAIEHAGRHQDICNQSTNRKENKTEDIFEETMAKNFIKCMKDIKTQIHFLLFILSPHRINKRISHPFIIVKPKTKFFKSLEKKKQPILATKIRLIANFFIDYENQKKWNN